VKRIAVAALLLTLLSAPASAGMQAEQARLHVTVDRAHIVTIPGGPITRLAVTNPKIADIHVVSPTEFVVNGKSVGVTSLVVFYPRRVRMFDLVVTPPPTSPASMVGGEEPHSVVVQRAGVVSEQFFARDGELRWVELGTVKPELDAPKK
jgi:Flp pilus assembly secretin CpaC